MASYNLTAPGGIEPPPGQTPNFNSPTPNVQKAWIAALVVILGVPTILMPLRIYVRSLVVGLWTFSDTSFIIGWSLHVVECGLGLAEINYGVGRDAWDIPWQQFETFSKILNIQQIIYQPAMAFTKNCILYQLIEIFVPLKKGRRYWTLMGLVAFNFIFFTIMLFLEIFECTPRAKIWNSYIIGGSCIDIETTFIVTSAINVIEDIAITILPIAWIFELQIRRNKQFKIAAIFAAALFTCVCSIMRLVETVKHVGMRNLTVALIPISLWSMAEVGAGLSIACLPYLPRIFLDMPCIKNRRMRKVIGLDTLRSTSSKSFDASLRLGKSRSDNTQSDSERISNSSSRPSTYTTNSLGAILPTRAERPGRVPVGIIRTFQVHQYSAPRGISWGNGCPPLNS